MLTAGEEVQEHDGVRGGVTKAHTFELHLLPAWGVAGRDFNVEGLCQVHACALYDMLERLDRICARAACSWLFYYQNAQKNALPIYDTPHHAWYT